ncbi:hypothetical protein CBL18_27435, partial [Shigella flexneri]
MFLSLVDQYEARSTTPAIMMKAITDVIFPCAGSPAAYQKRPPLRHPYPLIRARKCSCRWLTSMK